MGLCPVSFLRLFLASHSRPILEAPVPRNPHMLFIGLFLILPPSFYLSFAFTSHCYTPPPKHLVLFLSAFPQGFFWLPPFLFFIKTIWSASITPLVLFELIGHCSPASFSVFHTFFFCLAPQFPPCIFTRSPHYNRHLIGSSWFPFPRILSLPSFPLFFFSTESRDTSHFEDHASYFFFGVFEIRSLPIDQIFFPPPFLPSILN